MAFITYRSTLNPTLPVADTVKPSVLTSAEIDANFKGLSNDTATLFSRQIIAGAGLTGGGNLTANRTLALSDSGVSAGTYTKVTVDQFGRVTTATTLAAADVPIPTIVNDTTTNANTFYPILANNQTTGVAQSVRTSSTKLFYNPSTGTLSSTVVVQTSDERYKENIATIVNPIPTIKSIRGVTFDWKDNGNKSYGFVAQELLRPLPEVVHGSEEDGYQVNYSGVVPILLEAIKELAFRVEELERKVHAK